MEAKTEVLEALNAALKGQLTAINQTFLHARMAKNWGLEELDSHEYKASIIAMKRADDLVERILFLDGFPGMQALDRLRIGEKVEEMFAGDLRVYGHIRAQLVEAISICESSQDYVSRDLLTDVLEGVEDHIDWNETQQWQIENAGLANYIAAQMEDS